MANPKYVMFQRGSQSAYQLLIEKSLVDENTLYFIYDESAPTKGTLYLGKRLIADGIGSGDAGAKNLVELLDVAMTDLSAGDLLVKSASGKWINQSPAEIVAAMRSTGEYFESVDDATITRTDDGALTLAGFSTATVGSLPIKTESNGILWSTELPSTVGKMSAYLGDIENNTLQKVIASEISKANHLTYKTITDLSNAVDENVVYLYKNGGADSNQYDEYMVVGGSLEKIGVFGTDLQNYVATTDFENYKTSISSQLEAVQGTIKELDSTYVKQTTYAEEFGTFSDLISSDENQNGTVIEEINCINERLTWRDLT